MAFFLAIMALLAVEVVAFGLVLLGLGEESCCIAARLRDNVVFFCDDLVDDLLTGHLRRV